MKQTFDFDIVAAGHSCLDMIPKFDNDPGVSSSVLLRPGSLINVESMDIATGGCSANVGSAAARLGARVAFAAKVGDDEIGRTIRRHLQQLGDISAVRVGKDATSSYTVVVAPRGSDRMFLHHPGANDVFEGSDIDWSVVSRGSLFHFGYPGLMRSIYGDRGKRLAAIMTRAATDGAVTSLDTSLPDPNGPAGSVDWREIWQAALPSVDLFLPSIEEAFASLYPDEYQDMTVSAGAEFAVQLPPQRYSALAAELLSLGPAVVALKAGTRGWYLRTSTEKRIRELPGFPSVCDGWWDRELWHPAFRPVGPINATGAGDASIAGFLVAMLQSESVDTSMKMANAAGWASLSRADASSGVTDWRDLTSRIASASPIEPSLGDDWRREGMLYSGPGDRTNFGR